MVRKSCLILLFTIGFLAPMKAAGPFHGHELAEVLHEVPWQPSLKKQENKRAVAAVLAIALGPFGGHRLYMGTSTKVPIVYVATLGGGFFILPLIDLGHILFSKDLEQYQHNGRVFMWRK